MTFEVSRFIAFERSGNVDKLKTHTIYVYCTITNFQQYEYYT